jgi:hypothetical protein
METQEITGETEDQLVFRHRLTCFLLLGYEIETAEMLAVSPVDHHEVEELLGKGASREVAADILL